MKWNEEDEQNGGVCKRKHAWKKHFFFIIYNYVGMLLFLIRIISNIIKYINVSSVVVICFVLLIAWDEDISNIFKINFYHRNCNF